MVFVVSGEVQELSAARGTQTMAERCRAFIEQAACIDRLRNEVVEPIIKWQNNQDPPRLVTNDAVNITWCILRQGSLLCLLLEIYRSGILDSWDSLPESILKGLPTKNDDWISNGKKNVSIFLGACRDDLYMTPEQLFDLEGLFIEDTNTLAKAVRLAVSFLDKIGRIQSVDYEERTELIRQQSSVIRNSFQSQVDDLNMDNRRTSMGNISTNSNSSQNTQDFLSKNGGAHVLVLKELLETEKGYVADLERLQNYVETLKLDNVIPERDLLNIFANLDELVDLQTRFLIRMEDVINIDSSTDSYVANVANLFLKDFEQSFSITYRTFCSNHQKAGNSIAENIKSLASKADLMDPNVTLPAYLIKPIQRLCRYPLLLRDLLKKSSPDIPDRVRLLDARSATERVAKEVNQAVESEETKLAQQELFSSVANWKGLDPQKFGSLIIYEPSAALVVAGDEGRPVGVYLFANVLLMRGSLFNRRSGNSGIQTSGVGGSPLLRRRYLLQDGRSATVKASIFTASILDVKLEVSNTNSSINPDGPGEVKRDLYIQYKDDGVNATCVIRFRTEGVAQKWNSRIIKILAKKMGDSIFKVKNSSLLAAEMSIEDDNGTRSAEQEWEARMNLISGKENGLDVGNKIKPIVLDQKKSFLGSEAIMESTSPELFKQKDTFTPKHATFEELSRTDDSKSKSSGRCIIIKIHYQEYIFAIRLVKDLGSLDELVKLVREKIISSLKIIKDENNLLRDESFVENNKTNVDGLGAINLETSGLSLGTKANDDESSGQEKSGGKGTEFEGQKFGRINSENVTKPRTSDFMTEELRERSVGEGVGLEGQAMKSQSALEIVQNTLESDKKTFFEDIANCVHDNVSIKTIKYYDEQRDLISLLDDSDLEVAFLLSPSRLELQIVSSDQ